MKMPAEAFDAQRMRAAMEGAGTDEKTLVCAINLLTAE